MLFLFDGKFQPLTRQVQENVNHFEEKLHEKTFHIDFNIWKLYRKADVV